MADYRKRYKSHETDYDYVMSRSDAELCYSLSKKEVATILAMTDYIGWKTRWVSPSGSEISGETIREIEASIEFALMNPVTCGEPEEQECFTYLPNAPFIEWFPHDPFYEPDRVTEGYLAPAWYVANQSEKTVMTDLSRFPPGSLPTILPASGLPRFRIWLSSETAGVIEIHMFSIVQGSLAQVTIDDNPLTIQLLDLNKDIVALPPETVGDVILELEVPAGEHHIDVIIISQLDAEAPFLRHGGGLRQVVLCGLGAGKTMIKPQFRFTALCGLEVSLDGGTEWEGVPGWETYAMTCFQGEPGQDGQDGLPGQDGQDANLNDLEIKLESCVLQLSRDGGSVWQNVPGWTYISECYESQAVNRLRCKLAYGVAYVLFNRYLNEVVGQLQEYQPEDLYGFQNHMEIWFHEWFPRCPMPEELRTVWWAWIFANVGYESLAGEVNAFNQEMFARTVYTYATEGTVCSLELLLIRERLLAGGTGFEGDWMKIISDLLIAMAGVQPEWYAEIARMSDYGCGDCEILEDVPPPTSGFCHKFDFSLGADEWYVYTGEAVAGGLKTVPYQGSVNYLDVGLGLSSYEASWVSLRVQSIFSETTNGQLTILATVGGQQVQLAQFDQEAGGDNLVALPANATQLSIRASCGSGDVYILATYLTYSATNEIWLQNCE